MSDEIQEREVARRVFAAEFDDATLSYSESDEERAPNYVVTPTGARVNRLFAVGALTQVEQVNDDVLRGRIADPTGAFVTYAGQYQPDAAAFLERSTPPCFVSITGKGRTYQPEDSDRIFTSVRPESLTEVDADTRDRWVVAAADATLDRIATMAAALDIDARGEDLRTELESRGVDAAHASGVALAIDHYRPTEHYLEAVRTLTVQALALVSGDRDTVETLDVDPDEAGPNDLGPLPAVPAASSEPGDTTVESAEPTADSGDATVESTDATADSGDVTVESTDATADSGRPDAGDHAADGVDAGTTTEPEAGADVAAAVDDTSTADATADPAADPAPASATQESESADAPGASGQPDAMGAGGAGPHRVRLRRLRPVDPGGRRRRHGRRSRR
jgi:RPA family protein